MYQFPRQLFYLIIFLTKKKDLTHNTQHLPDVLFEMRGFPLNTETINNNTKYGNGTILCEKR